METARDLLGKREANMKRLRKEAPHLVHGFKEFITDCFRPGSSEPKTKGIDGSSSDNCREVYSLRGPSCK